MVRRKSPWLSGSTFRLRRLRTPRVLVLDGSALDKPDAPKMVLAHHTWSSKQLRVAHDRGFTPECVLFDSGYSSLEILKRRQTRGWPLLTRLKSSRRVNSDRTGARAVSACDDDLDYRTQRHDTHYRQPNSDDA